MLIHDPLTTTCLYSVSLGACGVLTGLPAPCRLLRDQQVLGIVSGPSAPCSLGTTGPVVLFHDPLPSVGHLLRNPNDL